MASGDEEEWTPLPEQQQVEEQQPVAEEPTSEPTPEPTPTAAPKKTVTPAPKATTPPPVIAPAPVADIGQFKGMWKGKFYPNALADKSCQSGDVSFDVASDGSATGLIKIGENNQFPGTGTVDSKGKLKGTVNYPGGTVTFNATLSGNTGTGSYLDTLGCFGGANLAR